MNKMKLSILSGILLVVAAALLSIHFQSERGTIAFGGQHWHPWKTQFAVRGDKLMTLPKARPGFNYGHAGSGRGPTLVAGIGKSSWRDYRAKFEYCVTGPDPAFNTYGLSPDYHDGAIMFHIADAKESWNVRGSSMYMLHVHGDGAWVLQCLYNSYCAVPLGFGNPRQDAERRLAAGEGLKIDRENGNQFVIQLNGHHIQIWVDDEKILDMVDDKMGENIGGETLDHGGIGFTWGLDAMGWIRHFTLERL